MEKKERPAEVGMEAAQMDEFVNEVITLKVSREPTSGYESRDMTSFCSQKKAHEVIPAQIFRNIQTLGLAGIVTTCPGSGFPDTAVRESRQPRRPSSSGRTPSSLVPRS